METDQLKKADHLIQKTRVMTLAVSDRNHPWSSPVYFVFDQERFCFFSNEASRHIRWVEGEKEVSASIFHDSDHMDKIFGLQMSGRIYEIKKGLAYIRVVKRYVKKFDFLSQIFGKQILENKDFFREKFKSRLYCFSPEQVFISDNSKTTEKRAGFDLSCLS